MDTLYVSTNADKNNKILDKLNGIMVYYISVGNTKIAEIKNSSTGDIGNTMYTIKAGVYVHILRCQQVYGGRKVFVVQCGNKNGYIPVNDFKYYLGFLRKEKAEELGLTVRKFDNTKENKYISITAGSNINPDALVSGSSTNTSGSEDSESSSSGGGGGGGGSSSSSGGGSSGEIDVTYEYAVKPADSYAYNIGDHLNDIAEKRYNDFLNKLDESGINYSNLRNIFGAPYQFLPTTDCRVGSGFSDNLESAGYEFTEKILSRMPLLYITPGNTSFMGDSDENKRSYLLGSLESWSDGSLAAEAKAQLDDMLTGYSGKLYTIKPAYSEYFNYVNPMCRAGAMFLGIGDEELFTKGVKLKDMNWGINEGQAWDYFMTEDSTSDSNDGIAGSPIARTSQAASSARSIDITKYTTVTFYDEDGNVMGSCPATELGQGKGVSELLGVPLAPSKLRDKYISNFVSFANKVTGGRSSSGDSLFTNVANSFTDLQNFLYCESVIPFYINSEASFQDSFSNETTESSLATTINALSDRAREIQFLLGTASSAVGEAFDKVDATLSSIKDQINSIVEKVAGGNSIFTTIANSVKTIVSGGRLLFPNIWANSNFSKSYNISIKLITPSYDKISWWLNIYVPLCHLMALVLPRSEYINSYTTPFIIKAFYKGMFNIDMGIITEMTFTKGKEGSWTKDALPTIVDVTFTIQDLYCAMGMTSTGNMYKGFTLQNVAEMDYIANLCGININTPDNVRMAQFWCAFNISNRIHDFIPNLENRMTNAIGNKMLKMYDNFWF